MISHLDAVTRYAEARSRIAARAGRHPGCFSWLSALGLDARRR